jgi:4a-hydroxytetrahydrobiopterin dehydratase
VNPTWKQKTKPGSLENKFVFDEYEVLRAFLDDIAELSEKLDHHPNLSFGRTHVSVIIYSTEDELRDVDLALAEGIDECFEKHATVIDA